MVPWGSQNGVLGSPGAPRRAKILFLIFLLAFQVSFGTQKGHSETYRGASYEVDTKPKTMFQVACKDDDVENIIRAVREVANTGEIGDGKIFVTELNDVVRIRTGETGEDAIKENSNE